MTSSRSRRRSDRRSPERGEAPAKPATASKPLPYLPPREWFVARMRNTRIPELRQLGCPTIADELELLLRYVEDEDRLEAQRSALLQ